MNELTLVSEQQLIEQYESLRTEADELQRRLDEVEEAIVEIERRLPDSYTYQS